MIRGRVVALLVAVVLGAGAGVATAVVTGAEDQDATISDPRHLGIPMVNLKECTGEAVLVVGNGDTNPPLSSAIINLPEEERSRARYLDTTRSCDAQWTSEVSTTDPRYVVYLGPADKADLCRERMTAAHRGDNVTFLKDGSDVRAECVCEVPLQEVAPDLSPGMETDDATVIWVKALQKLLVTIDENRTRPGPTALTEDDVTGVYNARTIARVNSVHEASFRPTDGVVDYEVWHQLTQTGCSLYDYN